jgi:heptosyltransferase-1
MRCLIIKISSLGDIIHTLPALTDAANAIKDIQFDWVVEENFSEIPSWHPAVNQVIPVALRRWKKNFFQSFFGKEWKSFKQQLKSQHYDVIIDAQGLLKSALLTRIAHGKTYGLDKSSAREPIASHFYRYPLTIDKNQHAVERIRLLFAKVLGYHVPKHLDYGIRNTFTELSHKPEILPSTKSQILFFHGTTWETKHWPEIYWLQLAKLLIKDNYEILLPWGNKEEKFRADKIYNELEKDSTNDLAKGAVVLPKMTLNEIVIQLSHVKGIVAVDTGLAHLAAALDIPLVSLFGPTNPGLTRPYGSYKGKQLQLQVDYACIACLKRKCSLTKTATHPDGYQSYPISPACYSDLTPNKVIKVLYKLIDK